MGVVVDLLSAENKSRYSSQVMSANIHRGILARFRIEVAVGVIFGGNGGDESREPRGKKRRSMSIEQGNK